MNKYIVIAFAFLGVWFYEASGGADFEPGDNSLVVFAEPKPALPRSTPREDVIARTNTVEPASDVVPTRTPDVAEATAGLTLAALDTPDPTPPPATGSAPVMAAQPVIDVVEPEPKPIITLQPVLGLIETESDPVISIQPVAGLVEQDPEPVIDDVVRDVRFVDGDRVNMRSGPGTEYGVVAQLLRNDLVEVITDNGDGWLQLRDVISGQEGWMADWLVTASN